MHRLVICFTLFSITALHAQSIHPSGKVEINGKTYRYTLAADEPAPAPTGNSPVVLVSPKGPAPAAVHVHALEAKLSAGTPLTARYEWDFGDPGSKYNNLPGWNAAHIYDKPGDYTITCTITDESGTRQVFTNKVTIAENNRRKIFVSPTDGNDSDDGSDEQHAVQTFDRAIKLAGDDCELLFHRGGTFEVPRQASLPFSNLRIGAWGEGDIPKLKWTGSRNATFFFSFDPAKSRDIVVEDLHFDTPFNQDTEQNLIPGAIKPAGTNTVVRNCTFLNIGYAVTGIAKPNAMLVQDNLVPLETGMRAYLVWVEGTDFTILGNKVVNSTREHIVRSSSDAASRMLIAYNDFSNIDRTKSANDKGDQAKTTINFRAGSYVYIANNVLRDGPVAFGPTLLMKDESLSHWIVLDGNKIMNAPLKFTPNAQHAMVRNNTFDLKDSEQISITPTMPAMEGRRIEDISIVHNTGTNESTKGKFLKVYSPAEKGTLLLRNNVYIAPNLKLGVAWACGVAMHGPDLAPFREISGNIWPAGSGPVNFVGPELDTKSYQTAESWKKFPQVSNERFESLTLDGNGAVQSDLLVAPVPGAMVDARGKSRDKNNCVPGAVQP